MRGIRTYHRRGRVSSRHQDAIARLLPLYGVDADGPVSAAALFGRDLPLVVEIGTGMGEALVEMAAADPARGYVAAEIHRPGIGNLLAVVEERGITNVRVAYGDALELMHRVTPGTLAAVHAFFPDPWPKLRHHKRRLVQPSHVEVLASRLRPGGVLWCATDWDHYAAAMAEVLRCSPLLVAADAPDGPPRPVTRFEQRALFAGRTVTDLIFARR